MSQAEELLDDIVVYDEGDETTQVNGDKSIVLNDTETGENYALAVKNGKLTITEVPYNVVDQTLGGHIVIGTDRYIIIPDELKKIAVQHDHNIETVTFDCPRYWDEHDMSKMKIYINYLRPDDVKGSDLAKNVVVDAVDENIMHFDWTITGHMTEINGPITFLVCVQKVGSDGTTSNHWNSELSIGEMYVSPGLECEETIVSIYPGIITSLLTRMDEAEANTAPEEILRRINDALNNNESTQQTVYNLVKEYLADDTELSEEINRQVIAYLNDNLNSMVEELVDNNASAIVCEDEDGNVSNVQVELDEAREKIDSCFQSVSDGKALVASAITDKRVPTDATATFAQMAANILKIVLGSGNAAAGDVLAGKTFTNDDGIEYVGKMPNNGAATKTLNCGESYTIVEGYHDGNGKVTANSLANQTMATALAEHLTVGFSAWVNGVKITGTRPAAISVLSASDIKANSFGSSTEWFYKRNTYTLNVTFSTPFDKIPTIYITNPSSNLTCSAIDVSRTGFTFKVIVSSEDTRVTLGWRAEA